MLNWLDLLAFQKTYLSLLTPSLLFIIAFSHVDLDFLPLAALKQSGAVDAIQRVFYAPHLATQPRKVNSSVKTRCADSYAMIFTPYYG